MTSQRRAAADRARLAGWLDLAARGWHLIPLRPGGKAPVFAQWERYATTDPERITRWFTAHPHHNAGIACGPSRLLCIDCDVPKNGTGRDGWDVLQALAAAHGGLPPTWTVTTPSGGRHLYFRADGTLGNSRALLGPMLDSRGRGGLVVAPGSRRPDGCYELLDETDPVPLLGWIRVALAPPSAGHSRRVVRAPGGIGDLDAYLSAIVRDELARVASARRGHHNTAVFTAARALGQLIGAGALDRADVEHELHVAAAHITAGPCDCTAADIAATARSGLEYGIARPRQLPTRRRST